MAASPTELTPRQRQHLKGLAHGLAPIVQIGAAGVTEGVQRAVDIALRDHELIKVRLGKGLEVDKKELGLELAAALGGHLCQVIGRILVLYRPAPKQDDRKIVLPK